MRRLAASAALVLLLAAAPAAGASVQLGVHGDAPRVRALTGQRNAVQHVFVDFWQGGSLPQIVSRMGPVPLLALVTGSYGQAETATPRGIALGRNDAFLFQLNAVVAAWAGDRFYLRPFPEMNGYWEATCTYNQDGSPRDAAHTTAWVRKAFARIAIVVGGGSRAQLDARLARLGLPGVDRGLPVTTAKLRMVWNPQGFGAPDLPGNSAEAYYPGDAYVDVVGDDLYDMPGHGATWYAAEAMYRAHPGKPFAFPEWGLWGIDDPAFVQAMATWIRTHPRTQLVAYYEGRPGSTWDLATKPRSLRAYRTLISPLGGG